MRQGRFFLRCCQEPYRLLVMLGHLDAVGNPMPKLLYIPWTHLRSRMRVRGSDENVVRRNPITFLNSLAGILNRRARKFHKVTGHQYNLIVAVVKNECLGMKIIMDSHR